MDYGLDIETQGDAIWCVGVAVKDARSASVITMLPSNYERTDIPIAHNAKFDLEYLSRIGVTFDDWWDTILEAHLLGHRPLNLGALSSVFLGVELDKTFVKERKKVRYEERESEVLAGCSLDAWATYTLHQLFYPQIQAMGLESIYKSERQLTTVIRDMERRGLPLSQPKLKKARQTVLRAMGKCEGILRAHGIDSPNDDDAVGQKFWKGKSKIQTTDGGKLSTTADHLREYMAPADREWVEARIQWKQMAKFLSTYLDNWMGQDVLHPSFNQTGTVTWRFSCSDPNLQNVPKKSKLVPLYHLFEAPPEFIFISADYSQLELKMLAYLSQDPAMLTAYWEGRDLHAETQTRLNLDVKIKEIMGAQVEPEMARVFAKTINFGIAYGMTGYGLAPRLRISVDAAQAMVDEWYATYTHVGPWQEEQFAHAAKYGYVETFEGRPLWIPGAMATRGKLYYHAKNQASDLPVQGGATEVVKAAMLRVPEYLVCQVHDELLYLVPETEAKDFQVHLTETLVDKRHDLEYNVDVHIGHTWGDIKSLDDVWEDQEDE